MKINAQILSQACVTLAMAAQDYCKQGLYAKMQECQESKIMISMALEKTEVEIVAETT
jgi:uncharacterized protein (UPF0264 family)